MARKLSFVYPRSKRRARKVGLAFTAGCSGRMVLPDGVPDSGPLALYGAHPETIETYRQILATDRDHYYIDNGYFGRGSYYRVTYNARQHDGSGNASHDRLKALGVQIKPWRKRGDHILVTTASELWYPYMLGKSRQDWIDETVAELKQATDREIRVRLKPVPGESLGIPFAEELDGAWALVTESSNTAVEAVLDGVPVFATSQCAATAMGCTDLSLIESPVHPGGRRQWAANLAANQWTLAEMQDGICWRALHAG